MSVISTAFPVPGNAGSVLSLHRAPVTHIASAPVFDYFKHCTYLRVFPDGRGPQGDEISASSLQWFAESALKIGAQVEADGDAFVVTQLHGQQTRYEPKQLPPTSVRERAHRHLQAVH